MRFRKRKPILGVGGCRARATHPPKCSFAPWRAARIERERARTCGTMVRTFWVVVTRIVRIRSAAAAFSPRGEP
ncbi:MAG: hypothetical protein OJF60_002709 [Burkholderiaceae bacterium]|nr:MAG: hypothetical protein OJF60_002709 [Burkholderiaceae bacterium]